jgi:cytochrome c oxidase subunit 2
VDGLFDPSGADAQLIAALTWGLSVGSVIAWIVVLALGIRALGPPPVDPVGVRWRLLTVGGVIAPLGMVVLLLGAGLPPVPRLLDPGAPAPWTVSIRGEQWWWRVRYDTPEGPLEVANQVVLPVGQRVALTLDSPDVIHSLWIPALAGKMDVIPGRTTVLPLEPQRAGRFRGVCAEYCGVSHAHMDLDVVTLAPEAFTQWLAAQRAPAALRDQEGLTAFLAAGCGACHTVRGTHATGVVGPDLTHVGSRHTVGAGVLPNDRAGFRNWLEDPRHVKPGTHMPPFRALGSAELDVIAAWLDGLE